MITDKQLRDAMRKGWGTTGKENGGGMPAHEPTEATLAVTAAFSAFGFEKHVIADYIGVNLTTLDKYYKDQLKFGNAQANAKVIARIFNKAVLEGDSKLLMFWAECRAGWKRTGEEVTDKQSAEMMRQLKKIRADLDESNKKDY